MTSSPKTILDFLGPQERQQFREYIEPLAQFRKTGIYELLNKTLERVRLDQWVNDETFCKDLGEIAFKEGKTTIAECPFMWNVGSEQYKAAAGWWIEGWETASKTADSNLQRLAFGEEWK